MGSEGSLEPERHGVSSAELYQLIRRLHQTVLCLENKVAGLFAADASDSDSHLSFIDISCIWNFPNILPVLWGFRDAPPRARLLEPSGDISFDQVEGIQPGSIFQVAGISRDGPCRLPDTGCCLWLVSLQVLPKVATHSLKATLLSFMAKAAAPENFRSIARYHLRSANSSTLEYSRDSMAPSLHFLEGIFIAIEGGIFSPDSTRAGRWTGGIRSIEEALRFLSGVQPSPPDDRPNPVDVPDNDPGDQSEPESAAESIGTEGEADEAVVSAYFLGEELSVSAEARNFVKCFRHRMSGVVHAARDGQPADEGEMTVFRCGRFANRNYEELDATLAAEVENRNGMLTVTVHDTWLYVMQFSAPERIQVSMHGEHGVDMSAIDSEAVFLSKCTQLGLPEEHQAKLRRLHFEAYALTAAELKRTAESTESDQPRKVPTAELAARYDVLQRRVKPLRLVDRLEPSHSLVNLSAQMLEDQRVRYIEWSKCTSRAQEINLVKEDASLKLLQGGRSGSVKLVDPGSKITADTKSDLEVMQALRRRGVAYELAAIMSFEKHEELIDRLFMEYQWEPMPGFHPISFAQLQAADREVHVRMGELTRAGLVSGADGSLPLDGPVSQVLAGSHIQWMLMPRQKGSGPLGSSGAGEANEKPDKPPRKPPKKTDPSKATDKDQGADKNQKADSGASPNAAERPGKQRKTRFVMPKALIGQVQSATNVHDTANSHLGNDRDTNAEIFAATLIGRVDAGGIRRLLELLPSEAPSRGSREVGRGSEFSFTTGAYTYDHGKRHGLRQHCRDFPMSTKVLNEFMRSQAPGASYTTLALFRDLETRVHSDHGNDPGLMNTILKVSDFSSGGLWVETAGGEVPCPLPHHNQRLGKVIEFVDGALSFDAQQPHCVMPWSRGPRVVLVAFTVRNWANLRRADLTELSQLGFRLPSLETDATAGPASASKGLPSPEVFPFPPPAPFSAVAGPPVTLSPPAAVSLTVPAAADHPDLGESTVVRDGTAVAQPSFIELFCGSAGLSAEVRKLGFRVLGADHKPTAKHANAPFVSLDLRDPEQQDRIWVELRRAQAVWIDLHSALVSLCLSLFESCDCDLWMQGAYSGTGDVYESCTGLLAAAWISVFSAADWLFTSGSVIWISVVLSAGTGSFAFFVYRTGCRRSADSSVFVTVLPLTDHRAQGIQQSILHVDQSSEPLLCSSQEQGPTLPPREQSARVYNSNLDQSSGFPLCSQPEQGPSLFSAGQELTYEDYCDQVVLQGSYSQTQPSGLPLYTQREQGQLAISGHDLPTGRLEWTTEQYLLAIRRAGALAYLRHLLEQGWPAQDAKTYILLAFRGRVNAVLPGALIANLLRLLPAQSQEYFHQELLHVHHKHHNSQVLAAFLQQRAAGRLILIEQGTPIVAFRMSLSTFHNMTVLYDSTLFQHFSTEDTTGAKLANGHRKWKANGQTTYRGKLVTNADIGMPGQSYSTQDHCPLLESFVQPLRKGQLSVSTLNLGGFSKAGFDEFQTWLHSDNVVSHVHIICLQETWRPSSEFTSSAWHWVQSGLLKSQHQGVAVLINKSLASAGCIRFAEVIKGRLLKVQLAADATHHLRRKPITIFSIYQHAKVSEQAAVYEKRERLWEHINKAFASVPGRHLFIAGGDFNTPLSSSESHVGAGTVKSTVVPRDSDRFASLLVDHGLTALNTWRSPQATYLDDSGGTQSTKGTQIDFLLARTRQAGRTGRAAQALPHIHLASWRNGARHVPVAALFTDTRAECKRGPQAERLHLSRDHMVECLRHSDEHRDRFCAEVQCRLNRTCSTESRDYLPPCKVDAILRDVSHELFAKKRVDYVKPWQSSEVQLSLKGIWTQRAQLRQQQRSARACVVLLHLLPPASDGALMPVSSSGSIADHCLRGIFGLWRAATHSFHKQVRALQRTSVQQRRARWDSQLAEAESALKSGATHHFYATVKRLAPRQQPGRVQLRTQEGDLMTIEDEIQALYEYWQPVFDHPTLSPGKWELVDGIEVSEQEVERALLKIPPRKATQPGMAPGAAWHFAAPIIAPHVHAFLQDTWKPGPISHSADLTGSWLHFLAKPGRVIRGPSDLRPIALQPGAAKALSVLIKTRLQPFVDAAARDFPQFAYLCNRGTAQAIGRVTQHCSAVRAAVKGQSLTLHDKFAGVRRLPCSGGCQLAVDMSRAFDSCPRKLLLAALWHFQVPSDLIALIMAWHESSHYELGNMHRSDLSRDISCTSGVKQGCVIAPSLWTLFTCYVGSKFSEHRDAKWIDDHLTLFADDFHFKWQLDSQKDCRRVLEDLRLIFEVLQEHGLTINPAKSSFLVEVRGPDGDAWLRKHRMRDAEGNWQFVWDLHRRLKVPVVRSFRYLGVMLSYHAFEDETLHFRLQQAQQHRNRLARTLQGRGGLRLEQRRRIWLVCVQTSQLYGLSAVGITDAGYNLLRIQTMKHVRAFAKSPRHLTQESDRSLLDRLGLCAPLQTLMQQVDGIYHRLEQPEFSTLPCYDNAGLLGWFRGIRDDMRLLAAKTLGDSVTSEPSLEAGVQDVPTGVVSDPPVLPVKTHEERAHKKFAPKRVVADIVSYSLNGLPTCKLCRASFTRWTGLRRHIEENRCPGLREEPVPALPLYDAADASGSRPSQVTATALDLADAAQPTAEGSLMAPGPVAASTSSGPPDLGPAQVMESKLNDAKPSSEGVDELLGSIDLTDTGGIGDHEARSAVSFDLDIPVAACSDQDIPDSQLLSVLEDDEVWDGPAPSAPDPSCAAEISDSEREWYLLAGSFGAAGAVSAPCEPSPPSLEPEHPPVVPLLDSTAEDQLQQSAVGHIHKPEASDEDVRNLALAKLKVLITSDPLASEVSKSLIDKLGGLVQEAVVAQSFADTFRAKASSTLNGHACALARFSAWCARQSAEPLRADEEHLYAYLCEMRSSNRGATSGNKFLQSLTFLEYSVVLLFMSVDVVVSARVRGVARDIDMALTKAPLSQRPALTVEQVAALEALIVNDLNDTDACVLGQILFAVHSAGRWRDIQGLQSVEVSAGSETTLLLANGLKSKTTHTAEAQRRLLPYVAISTGVSGYDWGDRWLTARRNEGLQWGGDFCLPSFSLRLGQWSTARIWAPVRHLRTFGGFLEAVGLPNNRVWASRSVRIDFSEPERLHLGHHSAPGTRSMLVYSREAYSKLYAKVLAMFKTIEDGSFNPDLPPARRVEHLAEAIMVGSSQASNLGPQAPAGEDSASSDDSDAGILEGHGERHAPDLVRGAFPDRFLQDIVVHRFSGISHVVKDSGMLWCHMPVSSNYTPLAEAGLDSSAYFLERLAKVGLSNELRDALARAGYTTFGSLAFAVSSTPGAASDEAVSRWALHLADPLPSEHQMSVLRRLLFEAQSMSIAEMRDRVNLAPGEAPTRKLPMIERAETLKALRRKLPGLILTPDTLPANRLVDNFVDQLDSGVLTYVKPDACISRAQEMDSNKRDPTLQVQGNELKLAAKQVELKCSISTDMQLRQAWTRRSLAMELAQLASFTVLETWVQSLFSRMQRGKGKGKTADPNQEDGKAPKYTLPDGCVPKSEAGAPAGPEPETLPEGAASPNPISPGDLSGPEPQDAESYALNLLAKAEVSASSVAQLSFLLPCDSSVRPSSGPNAFLFSCGAYVHGGVTGAFANTRTLPACTQLLARFAKQFIGDSFPFTSLVLLRDNLTHMHRDRNNTGLSALIRCSDFEGGGLWVADPKGSSSMQFEGKVHQGTTRELERCLHFDPCKLHCTLPWSKGPRIVLAAYSIRDACKLPKAAEILVKKLSCSEKARHQALPDHMKKVLASKNLSLFEALLKEHAYWDMGVVQLMEKGVDLVGFQDTPPCYPQKIVPATMSRDEFLDSADWRRRALTTPGTRAPDAAQLAHLEQACQEEVDLGFMLGPYSEDQVSQLFGHTCWSCIRRFVLEQKPGKLRPIDDAKEALVNSASTSTMRLELEDADYLSAMALEVARRILADPSKPGAVPWVARCLDLTKVYKQMCVSERDLQVSVVFFLDERGKPRYYVSHSLLFGCTSSVFAFNRVSKAISFLLNQMLLVPSSVFYDDFPLLSPSPTSDSATWATTALLDLLGWGHARVGKDTKGVPFAASFEVLGMSMQLDGVHRGRLTLQNKAGRIEQLVSLFQGFLDRGAITVHEAQVAHGLLNFSAGYVNGRALRLTCQELLRLTKASCPAPPKAIRSFCVNSIEALRALSPRVLSVWDSRAPIHIFTDGAWERGRAGIGAVIFDTASGKSWTYEGLVPEPLILRWEADVGTQLICQIELYAVVCLRWALASTFDHRRLIWWIDNESARYGLINGISDSDSAEALTVCTDKVGIDYPLDESLIRSGQTGIVSRIPPIGFAAKKSGQTGIVSRIPPIGFAAKKCPSESDCISHADADGQLRSLFGLMPALQAQQAQEAGNNMEVHRTSTKRKDPATNTTRQGSQKGKGKGGRGKYGRGGNPSHQKPSGDSEDSSDLRSLVQHMGRMVLQQAEATNRICLDSGFLLVLQTPPHPGSVTRALCQVGDAWKLKAKEAPTTLTMSLKMAILECSLEPERDGAHAAMNRALDSVEGIQPGPVFQVAGIGLAEGNWAEAWLARRRRLNLVATHSLKATLLSFMAKAAASENLRSIAGYHIRSANSSTLEYSRDSMAPSLHFLEGMFIAIKGGIFAPDSTRAGRWTGGIRSIEEALRFLSGVQPDPPDDRPPPADAPEIEPGDQSDPESAAESIGTEGEADEAVASAFFLGEDLNVTMHGEHAVFLSKCTQLGLPEDARGKLKRKGWATFGTFAFCVPGEPGRIPDDVFKTSVVQPILGDGGEEHQAKLRRLHFEAYALTAAELKRTAESTESDQPRKVPTAELAARYDVLQKRIKPLRLVDRLEPSHALVNLSAQMLEDQRVRYIEWSKCTSRAQEINLVKEDASLKLLQGGRSGSFKLVDPGAKITADTKSDLEVMQALRRRGVAYELAAIMSFERHEELIDRLFMEYQREPMAGFHPVSFSQLQAADREVHVRMGELTRAGLVPGADGSLPLDIPVSRVLAGSHIQWMLMPRQKGSGPLGSSGAGEANEKPDKPPRKPPKKTDPSKATDRGQGADKNQKADSGASPNAADRPGKPRKTRFVMPKALIGGVPKDGAGRNICFDHNAQQGGTTGGYRWRQVARNNIRLFEEIMQNGPRSWLREVQ
ncbi:unnamed protein product [Symbiodinium sp. CCMP2592]|nr:unnamed protein product [Symbiodinium sp. CCMP2592]